MNKEDTDINDDEKTRTSGIVIPITGGKGEILFDVTKGIAFATELAKFIKKQKLTVKIRNSDYVKVEGWQFAGMNYGVIAIPTTPIKLETEKPDVVKYGCGVDLIRISTGDKVGYGYGICSNAEPSKRTFQEYAIASMAQTRGVAKAYRNMLAWLIKAAGFEPTPAEEMEEILDAKETEAVKKAMKQAEDEAKSKKEKKVAKPVKPVAPDTDDDFELKLEE